MKTFLTLYLVWIIIFTPITTTWMFFFFETFKTNNYELNKKQKNSKIKNKALLKTFFEILVFYKIIVLFRLIVIWYLYWRKKVVLILNKNSFSSNYQFVYKYNFYLLQLFIGLNTLEMKTSIHWSILLNILI